MINTFYWHDYETFGIDPGKDRPAQFAGIRTDEDLTIIGEPLVIYCKPANDFLPQPEACLVTGITPQHALAKGLAEHQFIQQIHQQLSQPNTCTVGYNNIRFDDEFTRFILYRNFYDAYAREWQNGNSRWDLIDLLRMTAALRPDGINWPINDKGYISFRLEKLTAANGISHQDAHDALADVYATIAIAKLVKTHQPRLYDYYLQLRNKNKLAQLLTIQNPKPILHISGMYSGKYSHCAMVIPLMTHPDNKNGVIVYDCRYAGDELLALSVSEIKQRLYTPRAELDKQGLKRIALKTIHINKCPAIAPLNTLNNEAALRLDINIENQSQNYQALINNPELQQKLQQVFKSDYQNNPVEHDADKALYSGGFFSPADKAKMELITQATDKNILKLFAPSHVSQNNVSSNLSTKPSIKPDQNQFALSFKDDRLNTLFFRYMGRNFEHLLSQKDRLRWDEYRINRLTDSNENASICLNEYLEKINHLLISEKDENNVMMLKQLKEYYKEIGLDKLV